MSGITSGVGLVSGLPTQDLISQLIALESRPLELLQQRVQDVQLQRASYSSLNARLLGLQSTIARFDELSFFRGSAANSSDDSVLSAAAGENAVQGTFQFQVQSLVTTHQLLSRGFNNSTSQPVGAGTLSFEIGNGSLRRETALSALNGGEGVRRGVIEMTDSNGATATIDLRTAVSVEDVLSAINSTSNVALTARVENDRIVLQDEAGGSGTAGVRDISGGNIAEDLGIAQQADASGLILGESIYYLTGDSLLDSLNDGNGVSVGSTNEDFTISAGDNTYTVGLRGLLTRNTSLSVLNNGGGVRDGVFRITNRAGESAEIAVDSSVQTVGDLVDAIEDAGIDVTVTLGAASGLISLRDNSSPAEGEEPTNFIVENVSGSAAVDLGIVADTEEDTITGSEIHRISTLGDVIRAINDSVDASDSSNILRNSDVVASIGEDGRTIVLTSASGGEFEVASTGENQTAAADLGILGSSSGGVLGGEAIFAGMNTVLLDSLRGGKGIQLGEVKVQAADGNEVLIDFRQNAPTSVQQLIDRFNAEASSIGVTARLNDAGNGLLFTDESDGSGVTRLKDVGSAGSTIADLFDSPTGVAQSTSGELKTGNTQLQYISKATKLSTLNYGSGIGTGQFRITAADGASTTINITENQETIGQVLQVINALGDSIGVRAEINDNGDGIALIDSSGGTGALTVADVDGGQIAKNLNLLGEGTESTIGDETVQVIDGSYEFSLEVDADDTLDDVRSKINNLGIDVRASIVNDGGTNNAFHLVVNSEVTGRRGEVLIDTGDTSLSFDTLVEAQDAVVFFGGAGAQNPILLTSSTNTLSGVLENVTIDLNRTSDDPVELSITRDLNTLTTDLSSFVTNYNAVLDDMEQLSSFDPETEERGPLFGDNVVNQIRTRLRSVVNSRVQEAPAGFDRLILVGVRVGGGGRLTFDEELFREKYSEDPEAVEALFTTNESGVGDRLDEVLGDMTRSFDGLIARRDQLLEGREELFNDRIEATEEQIARKRTRLERQFQGLEASLANLQGAQNALGALASLAGA